MVADVEGPAAAGFGTIGDPVRVEFERFASIELALIVPTVAGGGGA